MYFNKLIFRICLSKYFWLCHPMPLHLRHFPWILLRQWRIDRTIALSWDDCPMWLRHGQLTRPTIRFVDQRRSSCHRKAICNLPKTFPSIRKLRRSYYVFRRWFLFRPRKMLGKKTARHLWYKVPASKKSRWLTSASSAGSDGSNELPGAFDWAKYCTIACDSQRQNPLSSMVGTQCWGFFLEKICIKLFFRKQVQDLNLGFELDLPDC